ncbi:MAG: choice-of-anchor Q domain-containing protein [Lysobacterales bacterium]
MRLRQIALLGWLTLYPVHCLWAQTPPGTEPLTQISGLESLLSGQKSSERARFTSQTLQNLPYRRGRLQLNEPLRLEFAEPIDRFALELEDPAQDSVYSLTALRGEHVLGTQQFYLSSSQLPDVISAPDGVLGLVAQEPFDRVEIREIHGRSGADPEYVKALYSGRPAAKGGSNVGAIACQAPLGVAYNIAFGIALVSIEPISQFAAATAAYTANLGLKFCKTVIEPPADLERRIAPTECTSSFAQPHMVSEYENALGVPLEYEYNWGQLGTPFVYHHNTEVSVTLAYDAPKPPSVGTLSLSALLSDFSLDGTDQIYQQCRKDGSVRLSQVESGVGPSYECPYVADRVLEIPVGRNTIVWQANAKMGLPDLISFPRPGVPPGAKVPFYKIILKRIAKETIQGVTDFFLGGWRFGNVSTAFQTVTIFDERPPQIVPQPQSQTRITATLVNGQIQVQIEADEPGGVSRRRYEDILKRMYQVSDPCGRPTTFRASYPTDGLRSFWPVSTQAQNQSFEITWTATDPGPNLNGVANQTAVTMQVEVVDIRPPTIVPPPDIVEVTQGQVTALGQPLVFDFVDLSPSISNNANLPLGQGLTEVTWTVTDASGNTTSAIQVVNVKSSNAEPSALAQVAGNRFDAVSFEPTTLRLSGSDPDGDPLRFFVEDYPDNGFFVAPLYPYFVEDFRVERSASEAELAAICDGGDQIFQIKFPSEPVHLAVTDDGTTFVADRGHVDCSTLANNGSHNLEARLAIFPPGFDPDGAQEPAARQLGGNAVRDLVVDSFNELIVVTSNSSGGNAFVRTLDFALNEVQNYRMTNMIDRTTGRCETFGSNNFCEITQARSAVVDANGVLYVMDFTGRIYAFQAPASSSSPVEFIDYLSDDVTSSATTRVSPGKLALDGDGFVYATRNNRVYKYSPSFVDANGLVQPGAPVGWLGRCDTDLAPGDEAVCDVANQRSLGFSCTDATCGVDEDIPQAERDFCGYTFSNDGNFGCRPGQFRSAGGIDIDPQGIVYIADSGNQRIQRFTPEGFFAGEAESECDGSCFVLGDFGSPRDVSVNSSRFYILDPATNLLHISLLTPFTNQGSDFAELVYQSNNDFACLSPNDCVDEFAFSVSDGVRDPDSGRPVRTTAAPVEVAVSRNFRPPVATPGIAAVVFEDQETPVLLDGAELDPLDVLNFNLVTPPEHGSVLVVGDEARYLSDPNYVGPDTFTFAAFDGLTESAPEAVAITVLNVNDQPLVSPLDDAQVGAGFAFTLEHDFVDPDLDDLHGLTINWGDGTVSPEGSINAMGQPTGPILEEGGIGPGRISANHVYANPGSYTLEVCVTDQMTDDGSGKQPTANTTTGCAEANVTAINALDLQLSSNGVSSALPGQLVSYDLTVQNLAPASGGLTATGVVMEIDLASEFVPSSVAATGCQQQGMNFTCSIPDLSPGASATVSISGQIPALVPLGLRLQTQVQVTQNETDQTPDNALLQITSVTRPADFQVGASTLALLDKGDVNPGDGVCASEDDVCTLRAALEEANASPGQQSIALGSATYLQDQPSSLRVSESVTLLGNGADRSVIRSTAGFGVIVSNPGATLRLEDLTVAGEGSGVDAGGDLVARGVRFTANRSDGSFGPGALVRGNVDIRNSTFDGNQTTADGAALFNLSGTSYLENVTVVGNSGGALVFNNDATLVNVTITGNTGGCCWETISAALNSYGADTVVTLVNSVLAGNQPSRAPDAGPESPANCATSSGGTIVSLGNNLLGNLTGCSLTPVTSDILANDAALQPTARNPAAVPTLNPQLGSQLLDGGDPGSCPVTDARGVSRPQDGNGDGSAVCDIGAVERKTDGVFSSSFEN